eukprot:8800219-Pyramimonas_sp.AAC.1
MCIIGVHVGDDLIAGSATFFKCVVSPLRQKHCSAKWAACNKPGGSILHCGRKIMRRSDGGLKIA